MYFENGDRKLAERYLLQASALDRDDAIAPVELGNFAAERKERDNALRWYQSAWNNARFSPEAQMQIGRQIEKVRTAATAELKPMRNPFRE